MFEKPTAALTALAMALVLALTAPAHANGPAGKNHGASARSPAGKTYGSLAPAPASAAEREIAALFDAWNAALASGDAKVVAARYAPRPVLFPSGSNQARTTAAEIEAYYEQFLRDQPQGVINERHIRMFNANSAADSGVYTLRLTREGRPSRVQARYTFLYERVGGEWKIVVHHMSVMPEGSDPKVLASIQ